jgi:hypothetical protein
MGSIPRISSGAMNGFNFSPSCSLRSSSNVVPGESDWALAPGDEAEDGMGLSGPGVQRRVKSYLPVNPV